MAVVKIRYDASPRGQAFRIMQKRQRRTLAALLLPVVALAAPVVRRTDALVDTAPTSLSRHAANLTADDRMTAVSLITLLECLKQHRYTPLACREAHMLAHAAPHPVSESTGECARSVATRVQICNNGAGACAYDTLRGWHCRCEQRLDSVRGFPDSSESHSSPGCIRYPSSNSRERATG